MRVPARENALTSVLQAFRTDMRRRSCDAEMLDDQGGDATQVAPTLRNLASITRLVSGMPGLCGRYILRGSPGTPLTIAELGAGGADLARWLARRLHRKGVEARIVCIDHDPRVVAFARRQCASYPTITVTQADARDPDALPRDVDWIIANHLLHHFDDAGIHAVLRAAGERARRGFIFNDLERSRVPAMVFAVIGALVFRKGYTLQDGVLSIKRGFTFRELRSLVAAALPRSRGSEVREPTVGRSGPGHLFVAQRLHENGLLFPSQPTSLTQGMRMTSRRWEFVQGRQFLPRR
jgi:2-polyprenyl-3-methyl-5-hydroxy-6-metoxy-1,4-benzoquinol methylase